MISCRKCSVSNGVDDSSYYDFTGDNDCLDINVIQTCLSKESMTGRASMLHWMTDGLGRRMCFRHSSRKTDSEVPVSKCCSPSPPSPTFKGEIVPSAVSKIGEEIIMGSKWMGRRVIYRCD